MRRNWRRCRHPDGTMGHGSMLPRTGSRGPTGGRMGLLLLMALVSSGIGFSLRQHPYPRPAARLAAGKRGTDPDYKRGRRRTRADPQAPDDNVPPDRTRPRPAVNDYRPGWMNALYEHELLTKADEQRLGAAVQRAQKLRVSLEAYLQAKRQEHVRRAEPWELDRFERWNDVDELSNPDESDDEDDMLTSLTVYDIGDWNAEELPANDAIDFRLQFSKDIDTLDDNDIISQVDVQGGHQELNQILREGELARAELLRCNFRLVVSIARRFSKFQRGQSSLRRDRPSVDEMIQEGILGLAKAVDRFQPEKDFRFATYATFWITDSVRTCFFNHAAAIRLPQSYYITKSKYHAVVKQYLASEGKIPDIDAISEEIGVTSNRLRKIMRMTQPIRSIDERRRSHKAGASSNEDESWDILDDLVDRKITKPEELIDFSFLRSGLEDAMASELAPIERDIIRLRLGLDDGKMKSARQVAEVFAPMLSLVEVQVAERNALKKLRSPHVLATYKLLSYLDLVGVDQSSIVLR